MSVLLVILRSNLGAVSTDPLLGPLAALAFSLFLNGLFYTGKVLPRNTVPREDYDKMVEISKSQAEGLGTVSISLTELVDTVREVQRNGGL